MSLVRSKELNKKYAEAVYGRAERLVHSIVPDPNYIRNPEKLDKWLIGRNPSLKS